MKKYILRLVLSGYLLLLIVSWLIDREHVSLIPSEDGWNEIDIIVTGSDGSDTALMRYRKRLSVNESHIPVLLIHGSPMASGCFDLLLQKLPADRTYLVPDLPGFGHSKYGFNDYSFVGHADALMQLLESEDIPQVHLVAYSQGGGPALELLSSRAESVASLTLLSSIGVLEHREGALVFCARGRLAQW